MIFSFYFLALCRMSKPIIFKRALISMKEIKLIKNRSDIGAGTRGSDMGIDAMEVAAISVKSDYFNQFAFVEVETNNESIYNKVNAPYAKRITHVRQHCQRVADNVKTTLKENHFPIVLSGDHSSALGTISGIKACYPNKRLAVIWIDAHADLHSPYTSPSGNIHGMPLAAALGKDNLKCQINEIADHTENEWLKLKNTGIEGPKILSSDLVFFGVRDTESPEEQLMESLNIKNYRVAEVRYRGLETCVAEAIANLDACDLIYISFDVDSLDCDLVSKGTGTPVSKGFDPEEAKAIITQLVVTGKVACLEVTEVNPLLDNKGNKMAETAFDILHTVTPKLKENS